MVAVRLIGVSLQSFQQSVHLFTNARKQMLHLSQTVLNIIRLLVRTNHDQTRSTNSHFINPASRANVIENRNVEVTDTMLIR